MLFLLSALLLTAGCVNAPDGESTQGSPAFIGSWLLVEVQSMDDRVYLPGKDAEFTLRLNSDGSLEVRADCNRGKGSWKSESPSSLVFSPLATTRAMCPPGSLHDRYLADLSYVRSYVIREGDLYLATYAGGAILQFNRDSQPSYDCVRAQGTVENFVCRDSELAALDRRLAAVFELAKVPVSGEDLRQLRAIQRGWIKGRNDCWKSSVARTCVKNSYLQRIAELEVLIKQGGESGL